jgi:uncharacterized RDD family membrane protein YckC
MEQNIVGSREEFLKENVEFAGFWVRFVASLLDNIIFFILFFVVGFIFGATGIIDFTMVQETGQIPVGIDIGLRLAAVAIIILLWVNWQGKTPGKAIMKIRIVSKKFEDIGYGSAFLRYIGYIVSAIILFIGYFMVAFTQRKEGLHDMIGGTYVVYEESLNRALEDSENF